MYVLERVMYQCAAAASTMASRGHVAVARYAVDIGDPIPRVWR